LRSSASHPLAAEERSCPREADVIVLFVALASEPKGVDLMKLIALMSTASFAFVVLSGLHARVASAALPEFLPGTKNSGSATGGKAKFEQKGGIAGLECEKSTSVTSLVGPKEGSTDTLFEHCKAPLSGNCTGLVDTEAGSILVKAVFGTAYINRLGKEVAVLYQIEPVHFECEKLLTLVAWEGCIIGLVTVVNTDTKALTVKLKGSKGVQEFTKDEVAECKMVSEINGGAFAQSDLETELKVSLSNLVELMA
jgi:hypothetical protein